MEAPVNLQYRDSQHQNSMLQALNTMRKNDRFCDVILHVGTAAISAHRAVLASASPHLLELFGADQDARRDAEPVPSYRLNGGMTKCALQALVDYAYTAVLDVPDHEVKEVYLGAWQLRMERVVSECARHLVSRLTDETCIETRSLPGIAKNRDFVSRVDRYISDRFIATDGNGGCGVSNTPAFLALNCVQIEVLHQTRQEMSLVAPGSLCRLVLDWVKRQMTEETITVNQLMERSHLLYLAIDNSLQDCAQMPPGQDSELVEDYKKMSQKCPTNKGRRKCLGQPVRPRVLIYSRDIGDRNDADTEPDWSVIASDKVGEHTFMALVTLDGILARLSILLRLNAPATPSPVATTPVTCRSPGLDSSCPDLYCTLASMSGGKCAFGVARLQGGFVVCGGYDRVECLKTVEYYDPENNSWKSLPNMREARGRVQIAVLDDKIYAIGGSNGTTELDTMEVLEKGAAKWSKAPNLPLARSNSGVCEMNGSIYCIGGWNGQVGIRQCDVFDPAKNMWKSLQPLTTGRYQAGVAAYKGNVYAIGGCDAWNCLSSVECYDIEDNVWSPVTPLLTPRRGCGVAVFNGKLYTVGGSDGTHTLSSTEVFDDESKTWVAGPNLTVPRANVGVIVVGDRLYAIGGFSGKIFLNTIEYLDSNTNEWTTFIPKDLTRFDFSGITDDDALNLELHHMVLSNGILNNGSINGGTNLNELLTNGKLPNGKITADEAGDCNGTTGPNIISV
ncbi:influenza virus NS1A-binding protein-like isoform X2 [Ctenocephalides felis]|nr:influenza virus NS1A-binding protein-like isoform X2 [Ctenocephalides felis]